MNLTESTNQPALFCIHRLLPQPVLNVLSQFPGKVFVAGGFLRAVLEHQRHDGCDPTWDDLGNTDVDLFVTDLTLLGKMATILLQGSDDPFMEVSDKASTCRLLTPDRGDEVVVQIVTGWTAPTIEGILESFDFTVCQLAYGVVDGRLALLAPQYAFDHIEAKLLVYTRPTGSSGAGNSLMRAFKFSRKGYHIHPNEVISIMTHMLDTEDRNENLRVEDRVRKHLRPVY